MIGSEAFAGLARETSAALGFPGLAAVMVPHPIGGIEPRLAVAKAEAIVDRVAAALTTAADAATVVTGQPAPIVSAPDDLDAFQDFVDAQEWGDGFPVLPPTPARVDRMLGPLAARRGDVVAVLEPRRGEATLEVIAANAVLAGARPEHLPVILAAVRAVTDPEFNLRGIQATTHPVAPLVVVNGPIARRLGIASGPNAFGGPSRANAAIGRGLRLTLMNVGGARPGKGDRATLGHPGKYSYTIAENEDGSPWAPLHVERGFSRDASTVTVCGAEAPHNVNDHGSTTAEALLLALAGTAATPGSNNVYLGGELLVVLGPEHARTIADSGWSKDDLKRRFWERARVRIAAFSRENLARFALIDRDRFLDAPPDREIALCARPEDVMVVVAGGPGKHSAIVPTFGATRPVTVAIDR